MKEKILIFYSKYFKNYRNEWEEQNAEIDKLRAINDNYDKKIKNLEKEKIKITLELQSEIVNSENKDQQIMEINNLNIKLIKRNNSLVGRLGGLTKYKNKLKKQNLILQDEKKALSSIIKQLSSKIGEIESKHYPNIYELKNMRKKQVRRGK